MKEKRVKLYIYEIYTQLYKNKTVYETCVRKTVRDEYVSYLGIFFLTMKRKK